MGDSPGNGTGIGRAQAAVGQALRRDSSRRACWPAAQPPVSRPPARARPPRRGPLGARPAAASATAYRIVPPTRTPIKHLVVIFEENVSFDHYFGTYPYAANTDGSPFHAKPGTPSVNGLTTSLLTANPNSYNPHRLTPSQALTCDQDHGYTAEQEAFNGGTMDKFVQFTNTPDLTARRAPYGPPGMVMDYYDGNTVTGLWNYAQNYAMSDNNYDTNFGPSTPGALNVISGNDSPGYAVSPSTGAPGRRPRHGEHAEQPGPGHHLRRPGPGLRRLLRRQPHRDQPGRGDDRPEHRRPAEREARHLGLVPGRVRADRRRTAPGYAVCGATHTNIGGNTVADYSPHHDPFQYYKSTANPKHLPPTLGGHDRPHRPGQPPVRPVRLLHHAQGREHAGGELPQGRRVPGRRTPGTPTRSTSSTSWSARSTRSSSPSTGSPPRSSSPTTTPTAGMTTRTRPG